MRKIYIGRNRENRETAMKTERGKAKERKIYIYRERESEREREIRREKETYDNRVTYVERYICRYRER